jgi:hypothetical protein
MEGVAVIELVRDAENWVRLKIAGYQFPELADAPYDSNWLIVEGRVSIDDRLWEFRDPCLLTYEAASFAHWLERHAVGGMVGDELFFTEPNLSVRRVSDGSFRVYFAFECKPPWAPAEGAGWEDYFVEAPTDRAMLQAAANAFREALKLYPQRTPE